MLGGVARKHTQLLLVGAPRIKEQILAEPNRGRCNRASGQRRALLGKRASGTFRTMAATEYPGGMRRLLARDIERQPHRTTLGVAGWRGDASPLAPWRWQAALSTAHHRGRAQGARLCGTRAACDGCAQALIKRSKHTPPLWTRLRRSGGGGTAPRCREWPQRVTKSVACTRVAFFSPWHCRHLGARRAARPFEEPPTRPANTHTPRAATCAAPAFRAARNTPSNGHAAQRPSAVR